jgi:hypothetical protein
MIAGLSNYPKLFISNPIQNYLEAVHNYDYNKIELFFVIKYKNRLQAAAH